MAALIILIQVFCRAYK